jgi:hypothetical protein
MAVGRVICKGSEKVLSEPMSGGREIGAKEKQSSGPKGYVTTAEWLGERAQR